MRGCFKDEPVKKASSAKAPAASPTAAPAKVPAKAPWDSAARLLAW